MAIDSPLTIIERSLYEAIRLRLVAEGLTPDITLYDQDTEAGYDAYNAELKNIKDTKGYAVQLFGTENTEFRGMEEYCAIALNHNIMVPGTYGNPPHPTFTQEVEGGNYTLVMKDAIVYDLYIDCVLLARTQAQLRDIMYIVNTSLPIQSFLKYWAEPVMVEGEEFLCVLDNTVKLDREQSDLLSQLYTYRIPDVELTNTRVGAEVVPIEEITLEITINGHLGITNIYTINP